MVLKRSHLPMLAGAMTLILAGVVVAGMLLDNIMKPGSVTLDSSDNRLSLLQARCVEDMVRQACRVMNAAPAASAPPQGVVFVAGVGPIDPATYATLQAAGDKMCEVVVDACRQDWRGTRCQSSRALFGLDTG